MNNMRKISEYVSIDLPDITENANAVGMLAISKGMKETGHKDIRYDSVHGIYSEWTRENLHHTITGFRSDECLMCLTDMFPEVKNMEETILKHASTIEETIVDPFADEDDDEEEYNE
jgi:hypothetical protein